MFFALTLLLGNITYGWSSAEGTVDVEVLPMDELGHVHLTWSGHSEALKHRLYRREVGQSEWEYLGTREGITDFADLDTIAGVRYEYRLEREYLDGRTVGTFVMAGHEIPPEHRRGLAILVHLRDEVEAPAWKDLWLKDVESEGWDTLSLIIEGDESPQEVKTKLIELAGAASEVAVLLVGQVPVPYSGRLAPDAHSDHVGAWPADGYYGELDGVWTDESVDITSARRESNKNVPGDGKFDQSRWPSDVDWMIGRVDLSRLPNFDADEGELTARYFEKNHRFRIGEVERSGALVDDNFGFFNGEAFAATGWSWSPLVGRDHIQEGDWLEDLSVGQYLWAYGCGPGSHKSAGGVGTSSDFAETINNAVFGALFGSYFGDWDVESNLMRSALATDGSLQTVAWSGRPKWFFHGMALGEPIGASVRRAQNNTHYAGYSKRGVHIALMGDPTLRMHPLASVTSLSVASEPGRIRVSWEGLPKVSSGFFVYLREEGQWTPLHQGVWTESIYSFEVDLGDYEVGVRPAQLEKTPSGSFWNLGQMRSASVNISEQKPPVPEESADGCSCGGGRRVDAWMGVFLLLAIGRRRSRRCAGSA